MGFTSDRANHSLTVAKQMYEMALEHTGDEFYARKMFHLGLVHDIGYQFTDNNKEHAHVGGDFLREEGYEYWKEVYDHGNPDLLERPSDEWYILNIADMKTDSKGNRVTMEERLKDIKIRYTKKSSEYIKAEQIVTQLQQINGNEKKDDQEIVRVFNGKAVKPILDILLKKEDELVITPNSELYADLKKDVDNLNNPYVLLAYKFLLYKKGFSDNTADFYFFKYLKQLENHYEYEFPIEENKFIKIKVDLLNPFLDEEEGVINPKWHFLVSFLAYIDVALNHQSELSEKIISRKKWKNKRVVFSCKSLKKWAKQLENGDL